MLVTSRNPIWAGPASSLAVDVLPRAEAVAFLQHRLGRDDPEFNRLANTVGDLPLALEQAAAYLEETATTPNDYLELLGSHARELFALRRPATTAQTIATTWAVSLQQLRQQAPAAEDLLVLCAFLAADDIPRALLPQHAKLLPAPLREVAADRLAYDQVLGMLGHYSLVTVTQDGLAVHRLVQMWIREALDQQARRRWAREAVRLAWTAFPADSGDVEPWPICAGCWLMPWPPPTMPAASPPTLRRPLGS